MRAHWAVAPGRPRVGRSPAAEPLPTGRSADNGAASARRAAAASARVQSSALGPARQAWGAQPRACAVGHSPTVYGPSPCLALGTGETRALRACSPPNASHDQTLAPRQHQEGKQPNSRSSRSVVHCATTHFVPSAPPPPPRVPLAFKATERVCPAACALFAPKPPAPTASQTTAFATTAKTDLIGGA